MDQASKYRIKVLEKALHILETFDEKGKELSATEVCAQTGLNKASLHRILRNLEELGYLERNPDSRKYRLGLKVFFLGSFVEFFAELRRLARPYLEELSHSLDETVHLVVLSSGEALYLDKIEGTKAISAFTRVGMKLPAHCAAVGKVLMSQMRDEELERLVKEKGLTRYTKNTITNLAELRLELGKIHGQGYAVDNEELEEGLRCVAAPLHLSDGTIVAAISLSGPTVRFAGDRLERLVQSLRSTAANISAVLADRNVGSGWHSGPRP